MLLERNEPMMFVEPKNCININEAIRYLGYQKEQPDRYMMEELNFCKDILLKIIHPQYMYKVFPLQHKGEELYIGQMSCLLTLKGNSIREHLNNCDKVALCCATLSHEFDQYLEEKQKENMLHSLLLDALANAALEEVRKELEISIEKVYEKESTNWLFGIGYGDSELSIQSDFLELINAKEEVGVTSNNSSILIPLKSFTGFIGISSTNELNCKEHSCQSCNKNKMCIYKK